MNRIPALAPASCLAMALSFVANPLLAQSQTSTGSITIERALTVDSLRPMAFTRPGSSIDQITSTVVTEAVIEVTGDPGRVYRVSLPRSIDADLLGSVIDTFTLRSENLGDITETMTARMNADGFDRLYIGGRLRGKSSVLLTGVVTAVPLTVDYE